MPMPLPPATSTVPRSPGDAKSQPTSRRPCALVTVISSARSPLRRGSTGSEACVSCASLGSSSRSLTLQPQRARASARKGMVRGSRRMRRGFSTAPLKYPLTPDFTAFFGKCGGAIAGMAGIALAHSSNTLYERSSSYFGTKEWPRAENFDLSVSATRSVVAGGRQRLLLQPREPAQSAMYRLAGTPLGAALASLFRADADAAADERYAFAER